jgi:tetratricopeptide (TPR) repeat protein
MIRIALSLHKSLFFWLAAAAPQQTQSSELARQHLESGIHFYNQQQYKQAINDFNIIVTSMADTEYADDALLRTGQYFLEVEEHFGRARENFDAVLKRYPTADSAPGAYYYSGLASLRAARGSEGVDDALANFQRVGLYPGNPWMAAALLATGKAHERVGRFRDAVDAYARVVTEFPAAVEVSSAQISLGLGMVRLGAAQDGILEIQRVRDQHREGAEAERALNLNTLLYRLYVLPQLGKPVTFRPDPGFALNLSEKPKEVVGVRIGLDGVFVLDEGRKRLHQLDNSGKVAKSTTSPDPRGLFIDARGAVVVVNEKGLSVSGAPLSFSIPEEKGPKPLEKIRAAARDRLGDLFVYDGDRKKVFRYDAQTQLKGPFPDAEERDIQALALDAADRLLMLERRERAVLVCRPNGGISAKIPLKGQGFELKKPVDMVLDPAGFLYVLDEEAGVVAVFDPDYRPITRWGPAELGAGAVKKPRALAVNESGDLYVYDHDLKNVVRLH